MVVRQPALADQGLLFEEPKGLGSEGIFEWFRYVQDFSGEFAVQWLKRLAGPGMTIWEPFSGSGTTLLASQLLGHRSWGCDTNPFMVEVAKAKTDWSLSIEALGDIGLECYRQYVDVVGAFAGDPSSAILCPWKEYEDSTSDVHADYPDDKNLPRWISPAVLNRFQTLVRIVDRIDDERICRFMRLAAASLIIPASNMTFRPNICYKPKPNVDVPLGAMFRARLEDMLADYKAVVDNAHVPATVVLGDSRSDGPESADVVFTSPPYPNDMEYVHQTRLELALLGHISERRDLTAIKKRMISSSVKLVYRDNEWQKALGLQVPGVANVYEPIARTLEGRNWGWNAADMVAQYFGGMRAVMRNWRERLTPGGVAAVVVGDSAFNGVKVETDILTAEVARLEGFSLDAIEVFRSRWNTKHDIELRESVVLLHRH